MQFFAALEEQRQWDRHEVIAIVFIDDDRTSAFYGKHVVPASWDIGNPENRPLCYSMWDHYGLLLANA